MSIQLTGASAKILFDSPAQVNLKKKLLAEGNFEIVSSGPESTTSLDKGITVVRTSVVTGTHPLTDEPIREYTEFKIMHSRENIGDVARRRLPRNAAGQLTLPGLKSNDMGELNELLAEYNIFLEPEEFTITLQGPSVFHIRAKNNCVIFYGKVSLTNTEITTEPLEVYEAEGGEIDGGESETPSEGGGSEQPGGNNPPPVVTITDAVYDEVSRTVTAIVTNASAAELHWVNEGTGITPVNVVEGIIDYTFDHPITKLTIVIGDVSVNVFPD